MELNLRRDALCVCVCVQEELYLQRVAQLDEITTERDKFKRAYEDLRKQRLNEFMTGFNMITNKLKENYQMLTLGGDAELELVDSLDPFSEGIMFRLEMTQYDKDQTRWVHHSFISTQNFWSFFLVSVLQRRAGKRSSTCREGRRPSAPWLWCLLCTTTNPRRSTSWTKSTLLWISKTSPLSLVTST